MRKNTKMKNMVEVDYTHEGAIAKRITPEQELRRTVLSCMLWEKTFYEDGVSVTERIQSLVPLVAPEKVQQIAIEARNSMKLRHVPLFLTRTMAQLATHKHLVGDTLNQVIQRPDELSEFLSIYWDGKRSPLSNQVKKGLANAFCKFNEYQLSKWDKNNTSVKLRDVLFLCHAKPKNEAQNALWKRLIADEMETPDTWETQLSAGKDKKDVFTRLLTEKKLGALALLRNLNNMISVSVDETLIKKSILEMKTERVLPFRFIAAFNHCYSFMSELEKAMLKSIEHHERLNGKTVLLIDVSGSMADNISNKSDLTRQDAAAGLAILMNEICSDVDVYTFSDELVPIHNFRGFALKMAIEQSQLHRWTNLGSALQKLNAKYKTQNARLIVFTDEQTSDQIPKPAFQKSYMVNVASYKRGVGYGKNWNHIDGFSEAIVDYIIAFEKEFG